MVQVVCAWCGLVIKEYKDKDKFVSHGICSDCYTTEVKPYLAELEGKGVVNERKKVQKLQMPRWDENPD